MSTDNVEALHRALTDMMATIDGTGGDVGSGSDNGSTAAIARRLAAIDAAAQGLGPDAPTMLRHYLEKRSYAKALDFLEGRDEAADPGC